MLGTLRIDSCEQETRTITVLAIRAGRICDVWLRQMYFGWPSSFLKFSRSSASKISRVCSKTRAYCDTISILFVIAHMLL